MCSCSVFPIAPHLIPYAFGKCCPFRDIGGPKGGSLLSFFLLIYRQYPDQRDPFDDNYVVDLSKTLLLSRQETKYKAIAF